MIAGAAAATPALAGAVAWAAGASVGAVALAVGVTAAVAGGAAVMLLGRAWRATSDWAAAAADALGVDAPASELAHLIAERLSQLDESRAQAHSQRAKLRTIVDALNDPVLAVDANELIVFANRAAGEFVRSDAARLVGANAEQAITQAAFLSMLRRALRGERAAARVDVSTHRGARIYDATCEPIAMGESARGAVMILRDVTDLARAARMKTDFVANASHELRTPLAAIRAALDTARLAAEDDPKAMLRFIDMAPAHLRRLEELTRDLIDLSRLEEPDLKLNADELSTAELLTTLRELFEQHARERGVTIAYECSEKLERFRTDPRLLLLILKNLIDNAVKFSDEGDVVRVVSEVTVNADGRRRARFEVRDHGIGIPLNQQQRVFERFYQVDAAKLGLPSGAGARKGTGLGLSIVKHAVSALRGEVGIDSVYQQGTTVWFVIPEIEGTGG